jgi:hypothetical protein
MGFFVCMDQLEFQHLKNVKNSIVEIWCPLICGTLGLVVDQCDGSKTFSL